MQRFSAFFEFGNEQAESPPTHIPRYLGFMLYDVFDLSRPQSSTAKPMVSLFRAHIDRGVLEVPAFGDSSVLKAACIGTL